MIFRIGIFLSLITNPFSLIGDNIYLGFGICSNKQYFKNVPNFSNTKYHSPLSGGLYGTIETEWNHKYLVSGFSIYSQNIVRTQNEDTNSHIGTRESYKFRVIAVPLNLELNLLKRQPRRLLFMFGVTFIKCYDLIIQTNYQDVNKENWATDEFIKVPSNPKWGTLFNTGIIWNYNVPNSKIFLHSGLMELITMRRYYNPPLKRNLINYYSPRTISQFNFQFEIGCGIKF